MTDDKKSGQLAGQVMIWVFVAALTWLLFLGLYALTQWTVRVF